MLEVFVAMEDTKAFDDWPSWQAQMGTVAQVHALGQITLMYNYLEEAMGFLFTMCMPTGQDFSISLFHKLNNRGQGGPTFRSYFGERKGA